VDERTPVEFIMKDTGPRHKRKRKKPTVSGVGSGHRNQIPDGPAVQKQRVRSGMDPRLEARCASGV